MFPPRCRRNYPGYLHSAQTSPGRTEGGLERSVASRQIATRIERTRSQNAVETGACCCVGVEEGVISRWEWCLWRNEIARLEEVERRGVVPDTLCWWVGE